MPKCVERAVLWTLGMSLTLVVWPLVLVGSLADWLTQIDPGLGDL